MHSLRRMVYGQNGNHLGLRPNICSCRPEDGTSQMGYGHKVLGCVDYVMY